MSDPENVTADERVRRSVARTIGNGAFVLVVFAILGAWAWLGVFTLQPGQAAVLLGLGAHWGTITQEGLHVVPPPPLVTREIVNVAEVRSEDFGVVGEVAQDSHAAKLHEATMQTSDNNIVLVSFSVQYRIKDAFSYRFRLADPVLVVRDAAQAAMRQVVGGMTVDAVLREQRAALTAEAGTLLQDVLDTYDSGIDIQDVQLQDVQPPDAVRAAFDDVNEATQDAIRVVNEADGFRNQTIPSARAEAAELLEQAKAFKREKIAAATGAASRFSALLAEYREAPGVTGKRLYLETMEAVLPEVEKVIVDPRATQIVPFLPLGAEGRVAAPRPEPKP